MIHRRFTMLTAVVLLLAACSCRRHAGSVERHPATLPGAGAASGAGSVAGTGAGVPTSIDSERYGIHLAWPDGWSARQSDEFVLVLAPVAQPRSSGGAETISLDVPSLPPHLPGMIRIHLVANGFLDDLKKEHGSLRVLEQKEASVPDATARRIVTTWKGTDGAEYQQDALLMVHADRVYILRGTAPVQRAQTMRAAFDQVAGSLKWIK